MKIAQLEIEIVEIEQEIDRLTQTIDAKDQMAQKIKTSYEGYPTGSEVYYAIEKMSKLNIQLDVQTEALAIKQSQLSKLSTQVNAEKIELHRITARSEEHTSEL